MNILIIAGSPECLKEKRDLDHFDMIIKMNEFPSDPGLNEYVSVSYTHLTLPTNREV